MTLLLTLIAQGPTLATRQASFPSDEPLLDEKQPSVSTSSWRGRKVLSSPKIACLQTAQLLGLSAEVDHELRDLDFGSWSGLSLTEVAQHNPEAMERWISDAAFDGHGGESRECMSRRMAGWLDQIKEADEHVVAVTHSALIKTLVMTVLNAPAPAFWSIDIGPATVCDFRHDGRRWALRSLGCPLPA